MFMMCSPATIILVLVSVIGASTQAEESAADVSVNENGLSESIITTENLLLDTLTDVLGGEQASEQPLLLVNATQNATATNATQKTVQCKPDGGGEPVQLVDGAQLVRLLLPDANVTSKDTEGACVLILFYAKFCPFSSMAAPHFNALARAFPHIKLAAIDAMKYHLFNTQNGIVGVPTLLLFHNGRPTGKFNDTEYTLDLFSRFLTKHTGIPAEDKSYVTSADFAGPVPSTPEKETDYFLGLSWLFIVVCVTYYFSTSKWWKWIVETVQNTWRESEAQHEHTD